MTKLEDTEERRNTIDPTLAAFEFVEADRDGQHEYVFVEEPEAAAKP